VSRNKQGMIPKALVMVEQAVHLLRQDSAQSLSEYYLGTLPFVLALLYFWSDMSRNPMAVWYCGPSAAGVAFLFIWMKLWQARFCRRIWCRLQDAKPEPWPLKRMFLVAARQAFLHATGFLILPLSLLIAFPFAWVYAFYQNLSILDTLHTKKLRPLIRTAKEQAALWPGQNHLALTILSFFTLIVFSNLALGMMAVPYLLKWLLGVETIFTISGMQLLNTTFLAILGGLTYLCIDPIVKIFYVLRCFYGRSRETGDDIRAALRPFMGIFAIVICVLVLGTTSVCKAQDQERGQHKDNFSHLSKEDFSQELDDTIESILRQRRFAWRLPREARPEETAAEPGWLTSTFQWLTEKTTITIKKIAEWIDALIEWLKDKIPEDKVQRPEDTHDYRRLIRLSFYALGVGLIGLLIYWIFRWLMRSQSIVKSDIDSDALTAVDLSDERLTAEDLPLDKWVAMAQNLMRDNDFRHALRALYLSVLALLADHQRITIARYKSNLDYARELARHAHAEPNLLCAFDGCMQVFEQVWYGMYPVDRCKVEHFLEQQKRMTNLVQQNV
jgi:hypothetical protein